MLSIKNVSKTYITGELKQKALDNVSLDLRDNEFVAILGPSGSGKTTLLNIIGGLDRYDEGDLVINGISTKKYKDKDWDSYRNHTIGFVFQSYNLIPHQTVLANVELALTISGIGKAERKERALKALEQVGLAEHAHKKPNQMSGGQMQRVAIARALINDPDIVLADEPTGALDSETSLQVMALLKEVAKDRLVVMVTHNSELADEYATRIVTLKDGRITGDTMPIPAEQAAAGAEGIHRNMGKAHMNLLTSLALSLSNLGTKKGRTLLTAFAGSIGIIGIALILALSTGVNDYINSIEEETLSEYPLQIQRTSLDFTGMMEQQMGGGSAAGDSNGSGNKAKDGEVTEYQMMRNFFSSMDSNDLTSLKAHMDKNSKKLAKDVKAIEFDYDIKPYIYRKHKKHWRRVNPDDTFSPLGVGAGVSTNSLVSQMMTTDSFFQLPSNKELYENQYDLKAGKWPENYDETVVVLYGDGEIADYVLYSAGLKDVDELDQVVKDLAANKNSTLAESEGAFTYDDIMGAKFKLVHQTKLYTRDEQRNMWADRSNDKDFVDKQAEDGEDIKIVGIIQPKEDANITMLQPGIGYLPSLKMHIMEEAKESRIVKMQRTNPGTNVFTGKPFDDEEPMDLSSLFNVDPSALENMFNFDPSKLQMDENALGDMDLSNIDFQKMFNDASKGVTQDGMQDMFNDLMKGYNQYAKKKGSSTMQDMQNDMTKYFNSQEVQNKISSLMASKVQEAMEQASKQAQEAAAAAQKAAQAAQSGQSSGTGQGQQSAGSGQGAGAGQTPAAAQGQMPNISISQEEMQKLAQDIISGYPAYAKANGLTQPDSLQDDFANYLATDDASRRITKGVNKMVDTDKLSKNIGDAISKEISSQMNTAMAGMYQSLSEAMSFDTSALEEVFSPDITQEEIQALMTSMINGSTYTYDNNLTNLGYAEEDDPSAIAIFPKSFESKEKVVSFIDKYNRKMKAANDEDKVISYTDIVGTLMSSVTKIINSLRNMLIAFVGISLVVSSIMIGVITYISVLERRKEIGILRAMGASKRNISNVFNAETFLIGLMAGLIGIGLSLILLIPGNYIIHEVADSQNITARLPITGALILIGLSVILTLIGGFIPSKKAAKSDPVTALRAE